MHLDVLAIAGTVIGEDEVGAVVHVRNHGDAFSEVVRYGAVAELILEAKELDTWGDLLERSVNEAGSARDVATMRLQELVKGLWVGLRAVRIDAVRIDGHGAGRHEAADLANGLAVAAHDVAAPAAIALLE